MHKSRVAEGVTRPTRVAGVSLNTPRSCTLRPPPRPLRLRPHVLRVIIGDKDGTPTTCARIQRAPEGVRVWQPTTDWSSPHEAEGTLALSLLLSMDTYLSAAFYS